jgi:hypothetical protein
MGFIPEIGVVQLNHFQQWLENNPSDAVRISPHPAMLRIPDI